MSQKQQQKSIWDESHNMKPIELDEIPQLQKGLPQGAMPQESADEKMSGNWAPATEQDLPAIHDDRLGSKTFVPNVALELYEIAAKQGDSQAQYSLGLCYHYGEGTLKDPNSAFKWFSEAAKEGHAEAQYSLGVYYQMGVGTPPDPASAFKWFEQAAIQNQAKAQHELGDSYYHGRGVAKDPVMAKKWINKSYINGNKWASESWEKYQLWKY